jgi:hypothetical protein
MKRRGWLALVLGLSLGACGCGQDADVLARIGRKAADRVQAAGRDVAGQLAPRLEAVRPAAPEPTLAERVTYRLQWDQALAGADIQVSVAEDVVELKGTAASAEQRRRALELAQNTVGAVVVVDALTVPESNP